ncbi:Os06g0298300 [Oryza sativa Japonica Group]|uniref:Os06g0298300 protein n=3 Tax=Oryza TaxID=4527 RepID=Q5ZA55_ORYSJ|nr:putative Tha8 [Oryza sativa Japonica Group]BAH93465.1 Os06g0298300 [Oryza sativa Japonica Group]|eukprot:NP_001174737.1 Os06g0298300 [Oryza sativa Japonica Group]
MAELQCQGYWSFALSTLHDGTTAAVDALVEAFLEEKEQGNGVVEGGGGHVQLVRTLVVRAKTRAGRSVYEVAVRMGGCKVDKYMYMVMVMGMERLGFEADFREWKAKILPLAREMLDEMREREEQHNNGLTMNLIII